MMLKQSRIFSLSIVLTAITVPGCSGLEKSWWLGVGGVAQVVAAVLSVLMVWLGLNRFGARSGTLDTLVDAVDSGPGPPLLTLLGCRRGARSSPSWHR